MKNCWIILIVILVSCHQYEDPQPTAFELPEELQVKATRVNFRVFDSKGSIVFHFEYAGSEYALICFPVERIDHLANSRGLVDVRTIITTPVDQFSADFWWQENSSTGDLVIGGNRFNQFKSHTIIFESIRPINPGFKNFDMLGNRRITISVDSAETTTVYTQLNTFGPTVEDFAKAYKDDPTALILNVNLILNYLADKFAFTRIEKIQE